MLAQLCKKKTKKFGRSRRYMRMVRLDYFKNSGLLFSCVLLKTSIIDIYYYRI